MSQHEARDGVHIDLSDLPTQADIPLRDLSVSKFNPRRRYDPETIKEFANSIEKDGLIQNLVARPDGNGGFEVVAGSRRFRALQHLHGEKSDETARCNVHDYDDETAKRITLVENLQNEELTYVEEARGLAQLVTVEYREDENDEPVEESFLEYINAVREQDLSVQVPSLEKPPVRHVAEEVGMSPSNVNVRLSLLPLSTHVRGLVEDGDLNSEVARYISTLRLVPDAEFRDTAMTQLAEQYKGAGGKGFVKEVAKSAFCLESPRSV